MTEGPAFHSDEELIRRLQGLLRASSEGAEGLAGSSATGDARTIAAELAERVLRDPARWGLDNVPQAFRDDAATDAFMMMLYAVPNLGGRQGVAEWFSITVESRFRRLWALSERQSAERERLAAEAPEAVVEPATEPPPAEPETPSLFEVADGVWSRFEYEFPRDAFALRLRYLLKRSPEEMAVMLDAPSSRAIDMRLNRARDRFKMYCEQSGMSRREIADVIGELAEEPTS